jgi:pimeloyl-ACP methyl ester carboxylesterase
MRYGKASALRAWSILKEVEVHLIEGHGEPIVFVHGNASTHETWAGVTKQLKTRFRCVSYDLRGHGGGPLPAGDLNLSGFVNDLEVLRTELKLDRPYIVGHSLGAFIATAYIAQYPERVRAACLLAAPAGRTETSRKAASLLVKKLRSDGVANTMASLLRLWYTDEFIARNPDVLRTRIEQIASIDEDVFIRTYELYNRTDIEPLLREVKAPVLVMTGEFANGAGAAVAKLIAEQLQTSKLAILAGFKNGILTEIPERISAELFAFFHEHRSN